MALSTGGEVLAWGTNDYGQVSCFRFVFAFLRSAFGGKGPGELLEGCLGGQLVLKGASGLQVSTG